MWCSAKRDPGQKGGRERERERRRGIVSIRQAKTQNSQTDLVVPLQAVPMGIERLEAVLSHLRDPTLPKKRRTVSINSVQLPGAREGSVILEEQEPSRQGEARRIEKGKEGRRTLTRPAHTV